MCETCGAPGDSLCAACEARPNPSHQRVQQAQKLAKASWATALMLYCAFAVFAQADSSATVKALVIVGMGVAGLSFGIVALVLSRGMRAPKTLVPAIAGIALSLLPLTILGLSAFFFIRNRG